MKDKNYTEVLIDGNIYTLGGSEEEAYLQRVASYINEVIARMRKQDGFLKQSTDYQTVMVELNMADDYFKMEAKYREMTEVRNELEKETYSLKHELVTTQMKLEHALKQSEEDHEKLVQAQKELEEVKAQLEQMKAYQAAKVSAEARSSHAASGNKR
ncbi:MAG: cell division protein ZapA [Lachnospiraceae bacterium]